MRLLWCIAMAASALAQPAFLNMRFDVRPNEPFTLYYSGCDYSCTLELLVGEPEDFRLVKTISRTLYYNRDSFTFTMDDDLPSEFYCFRLSDNASGEENFSAQFEYDASDGDEETSTPVRTSSSRTPTTISELPGPPTIQVESSLTTSSDTYMLPPLYTTAITSITTTSITTSSTGNVTGDPDDRGSGGLSAGELAGTVIGVVGGVLLFLGALFLWWRRRNTKRARRVNEDHTPQLQVSEVGLNEKAELPATSPRSMTLMTAPAELSNQSRAPELPTTEQEKYNDLPPKTTWHELDGDQEVSIERKPLPSSHGQLSQQTGFHLEQTISAISPSDSSPEAKTTPMPDIQSEQPTSQTSTDLVSFVPEPSNEALLMDQYAQLEARRQRLLELDRIEKEQAELQSRINEMAVRKRQED